MTADNQNQIDPQRKVGWSGGEILAVFFLASLWPPLLYWLLLYSGWYSWFYGPDFFPQPLSLIALSRMMLWSGLAALPLELLSTFAILRAVSDTGPTDVGLTTDHIGKNLRKGLLAALILIPVVYGVQGGVMSFVNWMGWPTVEHPFTKLGDKSLYPVEWGLLLTTAVVAAPIWEELLFRGLVQPWVLSRSYGGWAVLFVTLAWTLVGSDFLSAKPTEPIVKALFLEVQPLAVLLGLFVVYAVVRRKSEPLAGLFATAVFFGWVHASVWPTPIPLMVLGLGLGWLARSTNSLVGPIVVHALFNAVASTLLLLKAFYGLDA